MSPKWNVVKTSTHGLVIFHPEDRHLFDQWFEVQSKVFGGFIESDRATQGVLLNQHSKNSSLKEDCVFYLDGIKFMVPWVDIAYVWSRVASTAPMSLDDSYTEDFYLVGIGGAHLLFSPDRMVRMFRKLEDAILDNYDVIRGRQKEAYDEFVGESRAYLLPWSTKVLKKETN